MPKKGRFRKYSTEVERKAARAAKAREAGKTEKSRAYHREYDRARRKTPAGKARDAAHAARRRRGKTQPITGAQWLAVCKVFGNQCAYGPHPIESMDHFVPIARGGEHALANVVPSCKPCNSSKSDSDPFEWMEHHGVDVDRVVAGICETRSVAA